LTSFLAQMLSNPGHGVEEVLEVVVGQVEVIVGGGTDKWREVISRGAGGPSWSSKLELARKIYRR
jgi:dihydrodipicolinate synthase/N-acetylneuraminate lyase